MDSLDDADLIAALDTRKLIGQAQGILMEHYGLDETRAFGVLRRYSQDQSIKLRDIAQHLIAERHLPSTDEATGPKDTVTPA